MSEEPEFCRTQCEEGICSPGCHVKPEHRIGAAIAQPAKGHYCPTCNTADEWLIMCSRAESNVRSGVHKVDGEWRFEGDPEDFATILSESAKITQQIHAKRLADLEATNADLTARCARLAAALEKVIANRVDDGGPCDGDATVCVCSECVARSALTADDRALAELWRAMEEEHKAALEYDEWIHFSNSDERTRDCERWRAAVRAVSALAASFGG